MENSILCGIKSFLYMVTFFGFFRLSISVYLCSSVVSTRFG
jgi:hypothetical protein